MSEITSSIRIEDGFTEPLRNLAKASWDVESAATSVSKSLLEQKQYFKSLDDEAQTYTDSLKSNLIPRLISLGSDAVAVKDALSNMIDEKNFDSVKEFSQSIEMLKDNMKESAKDAASWAIGYSNAMYMINHKRSLLIGNVSMSAFHKMKDSYIKGVHSLMDSIGKSIDEINITEKLSARFSEAGDVARKRAYELANEIGENATTVSELAAKAGYEGIGTEHFERMAKLADKVSKLRPGESFESVTSNLISNIKSGHDASSIAQMFGGGQRMERKLINAGYERALNRGDLDKALEIAEKIAEQAGLTDEKYQTATDNLSNNYKKIMNSLDNVQRRLSESFNKTFAPTVKKIKELFESQKFKTIVNVADYLISKVGKFLNWFTEAAVDNIHVIGVLLGVGIVSKVVFILPKIKIAIKLLAMAKGPIGWIVRGLSGVVGKLVTIIAKQGIVALKSKALAALKIAGPWIAAGAAVAGITYGIYKLTGTTKSFTGWLKGVLAAGYQGAMNAFTNVFIFIDRLGTRFKQFGLILKSGVYTIIGTVKSKFGELLGWIIGKLLDFVNSNPVLSKIMEALDVDTAGLAASAQEWTGSFGKDELSEASKIASEIDELGRNITQYIDVTQGVMEAYESEGATVVAHLKTLIGLNKQQAEEQKGIKTNSDEIRRQGEQEEELRWLKAFSDRQIMSSYNSMTSNNRTINLNGVSQNTMAEAYRRNRSTIPSRASM